MKNRSKWVRSVALLVLLAVSHVADAGITLYYTPDLKHEGNPLASVPGLGVNAFFAINIALSLLIAAVGVFDVWYRPKYPEEKELSFSGFVALYYCGKKTSLWRASWRMPKDLKTFLQLAGYALPRLVILGSFYAAAAWYLTHHHGGFRAFHNRMYPYGYLVAVFLLIALLAWYYYRREYRNYRSETGVVSEPAG
jgi:hypothetical protein